MPDDPAVLVEALPSSVLGQVRLTVSDELVVTDQHAYGGMFGSVKAICADDTGHALSSYRGLARREPLLAGMLTLFLLAQAGIPMTSGFIAKLSVFAAAVGEEQYALAIVGVLAAVVAAFVYLRVIVSMYMERDGEEPAPVRRGTSIGRPVAVVLAVAGVVTVLLGVLPSGVLDLAKDATLLL